MNKWKIWYQLFDENGLVIGIGVLCKTYRTKGNATKYMNKVCAECKYINAIVSETNPFIDSTLM